MSTNFLASQIAKALLVDVLGIDIADRIVPHAMLVDDLGADSLDYVELQCEMSDRLGLEVDDEALTWRMTVADFTALILPTVEQRLAKVMAE
jgi:acyl carrier protein